MNASGYPVAVTWKLPAVPTTKVVSEPLVIAGCSLMVSVKFWGVETPTPLETFITSVYTPPVPVVGVPLSRPALDSVSPSGRLLAVVKAKVPGKPLAVNWKVVPETPAVKVLEAVFVNAAVSFTVRVNDWSVVVTLLVARMVMA